ncbi:hypothetical protein N0V90_011242 [Kalmusia sp. IMI 367209]|nr:hypothetical protein N0V90_011242 [Kalmusia sp. IMI 367209]
MISLLGRTSSLQVPRPPKRFPKIVRTLFQQEDCKFAVRSGGHSSNAGANNIEEGVTIDLGRMNATTYNPTTKTASLCPGARWLDVYRTLDALNVSIQGGGIGSIGVGGLLLGGGFSPYLYARGFALDDILAHEVVLANGTVVSATSDVNADLYQALKGAGANNFGIVTRYDMRTFERVPLWSAYREYNSSESVDARHIRALERWTDNPDAYEHGSAFVWWTYRPREDKTVLISALSDTAGRARPRFLDEFLSIKGYTIDEEGLTNMSTSAQAFQATGYRNIWFTLTFKNDGRVITKAVDLHRQFVEDLKQNSLDGDFETQCYFQPFPAVIGQRGAEKGGNILGIEDLNDNAVVLLGSLAVNGVDQEAMGRQKILAWKDAVEEYSRSVGAFVSYRYINYADASQDVLASYGADNLAKMRAVSQKYDPDGVFLKRVSGIFKLSST